jgi:hypothetical protein
MNEQIKELAEQAELIKFKFGEQGGYTTIEAVSDLNNLERFVKLVDAAAVAREREACAKLCEEQLTEPKLVGWNGFEYYMTQCAARIRGRTE